MCFFFEKVIFSVFINIHLTFKKGKLLKKIKKTFKKGKDLVKKYYEEMNLIFFDIFKLNL